MSDTLAPGPQVLRGMRLEPATVRLRSGRPIPLRDPVHEEPSAEDELRRAREQAVRDGREQGLRSGHAEGLQQGRAAGAEEVNRGKEAAITQALVSLQAEHDSLRRLADSIRLAKDEAIAAAHEDMLALCYETICRMVGCAAAQPDVIEAQLEELLRLHQGQPSAVLHVHPQDAELLASRAKDGSETLRWTADPQVRLGGCILRWSAGGLDARLETMLAACKAALLEARARDRVPPLFRGETS